jgi:hypothetical protein
VSSEFVADAASIHDGTVNDVSFTGIDDAAAMFIERTNSNRL